MLHGSSLLMPLLVVISALFLTEKEIEDAAKTLKAFESGALAPGSKSDAELWKARRGTLAQQHGSHNMRNMSLLLMTLCSIAGSV